MRQIDKAIFGGGTYHPLQEKENRRMSQLFYENNKDQFKDCHPGLPKSDERENKRHKMGKEGGGYIKVKTKHINTARAMQELILNAHGATPAQMITHTSTISQVISRRHW